ncbi:hypothetical protein ANN_16899 [Periplaneta americana]|uniref:Uncharacterized protein n=1 Tax=Periplaneta americana TaxID=6978 RepID=A0ABQ8SRE0_PERAM|nr:hypothetical protein ANN_16899 [Periplaneta americana]
MEGLCEGGTEPSSSLKATVPTQSPLPIRGESGSIGHRVISDSVWEPSEGPAVQTDDVSGYFAVHETAV